MTGVSNNLNTSPHVPLEQFERVALDAPNSQKLTVHDGIVEKRDAHSTIGGKFISWIKTNITGDQIKSNDQAQFRSSLVAEHGDVGERAYQAACDACGISTTGRSHSLTAELVRKALSEVKYNANSTASTADRAEVLTQNKGIIQHFRDNPELLENVGIGRKTGNKVDQNALIEARTSENFGEAGEHALATVLKQNLKQNLTGDESKAALGFIKDFVEHRSEFPDAAKLPAYEELPELLQGAVVFAKMVHEHREVNLMHASNLGVVFGPNILDSYLKENPEKVPEALPYIGQANSFFAAMVEQMEVPQVSEVAV